VVTHGRSNTPIAAQFLVRRGPSGCPLFASWPWPRYTGGSLAERPARLRIVWGVSPHAVHGPMRTASIAKGGEGTHRQRLGRRSHGCPVDHETQCGRSDLGGEHTRRPAQQRRTAAPLSSPYGSRWTDTVGCRAGANAAQADVLWEATGGGTRGTAGGWGHASGARGAERTPGRATAQQGRATTCTDPRTAGPPRAVGGVWSGV